MSDRLAPAAYAPAPRPEVRAGTLVSEPRCGDAPNLRDGCGRMLARLVSAPAHIDCPRCKKPNIWGE